MHNDQTRPLILLGSNSNIHKIVELAQSVGVQVHGIIDDDYHGQGSFKNMPVLGQEQDLDQFLDYQFLCVTNWTPDPPAARNRHKRARQLSLIKQHGLKLATLVSPLASVSSRANIAAGTVVYPFATIEPEVTIGEHCLIYEQSTIGHESIIGHNVVIQRYVGITSLVHVEDNVYFGLGSRIYRSHATVSAGTFVHPNITLLRGTVPDEIVSLAGRKTYGEVLVE